MKIKTSKFIAVMIVFFMAVNIIIPSIVIADEVSPNIIAEEIKTYIYNDKIINMADASPIEVACFSYLEEKGLIIESGSMMDIEYYSKDGKKLFDLVMQNMENYETKCVVANNVTTADNIVCELDTTDQDTISFFQAYGFDTPPSKVSMIFSKPEGYEVEINLYDGYDVSTMSSVQNACMSYLFLASAICSGEDGTPEENYIYKTENMKPLMYIEDGNHPTLHLFDGVTSADSFEATILKTDPAKAVFNYYGIVDLPDKVKINFKVESTLKGDLDKNNVIDANDASMALEIYKAENATAEDISIGDMDGNKLIDANDASLILELYKTNN